MKNSAESLREFATHLASGPAFLILGEYGIDKIGPTSIGYRWNGIYTSTTDRRVADTFSDDSRSTTSVGAMTGHPSRSRENLEIRYLFGGTHLPEGERPPSSVVEEVLVRNRSNQELTRLATETVTPKGTIVIEGWSEGKIGPEELLPIFTGLRKGQVHLFSARYWGENELVSALAASGQLVIHERSLEDALVDLTERGSLKVAVESHEFLSQRIIPLGEGFIEIDILTWNQIRRSARPVDLELLTPPNLSSNSARYQEFRNFIGAAEGVPRWSGITAGMNLSRDFETQLLEAVHEELKERKLPKPIILCGQTATGKSIALAALAVELARRGEVTVLHQSRRTVRPAVDDIDSYCAWSAENGAKATVLIWDGMLDPKEYEAFARQLHARGRKFMLIGSSYKVRRDKLPLTISAPAKLSLSEVGRLRKLLDEFGYPFPSSKSPIDTSFLALLYRFLPDTEYQLKAGLSKEMRSAESVIAELASNRETDASVDARLTAMQAAFRKAGFEVQDLLPVNSSSHDIAGKSFAERAPLQRVIALILVAGKHGIPVPIDLALRILGREGFQSVYDALFSTDIIREIDDNDGNYFLSPRSKLEAELLARHEVDLPVEIEVIVEAIKHVRITSSVAGGANEVEFIVKLLERIGPSSDGKNTYKSNYGNIADALKERRMELGYSHPRLVLQESVFVRSYAHWQQENDIGTLEDRVTVFEYNRDLLETVLLEESTRGLIRLSLSVELASTLGAIIYEFAKNGSSSQTQSLGSRLEDVLSAVLDARLVDPGNLYPIDVLAWSTRDAIESGTFDPSDRMEHLANAIAILESIDRNSLNPDQKANLDRRGGELQSLLKNDEEVWQYLMQLEQNTSPAAVYFLSQFDAKEGPEGEEKALLRLRNSPPYVREDWRCAQLLVDLTWKNITGNRILSGERVPVFLSSDSVSQIKQLVQDVGGASLPEEYRFMYIRAISAFFDQDYRLASDLFRESNDLTKQLSKRIRTSYIIADENGNPLPFTGRVDSLGARWGKVWVEKLATKISFEPVQFSSTGELATHQQLGPFYIGFKLSRGPVAEPTRLFRRRDER